MPFETKLLTTRIEVKMDIDELSDELAEEFPERPPAYADTVVERFKKNMEKVEINKEVLKDVKTRSGGVKVGYRYRFGNDLYEVTLITDEPRYDEPKAQLAKVLDTKVSDALSNKMTIELSKLDSGKFKNYNRMVDKAYKLST